MQHKTANKRERLLPNAVWRLSMLVKIGDFHYEHLILVRLTIESGTTTIPFEDNPQPDPSLTKIFSSTEPYIFQAEPEILQPDPEPNPN